MKWIRKINFANFIKIPDEQSKGNILNIFVPGCGWGVLEDLNAQGKGYIRFNSGGGQIIRSWNHFLEMAEQIEVE